MDGGLIQQGMTLSLFGMGTVMVFLGLLVFVTRIMSYVVVRYFPDALTEENVAPAAQRPLHPDKQRLLAVISASVAQFRKSKSRK